MTLSLLNPLHLLSVVVWVGGMFFAYMALRPAAASTLEPPFRLRLWRATFKNFFPWVWAAIITLLVTGYWMIFGFLGGMAGAPLYVHTMMGLGLLMMAIFMHVYFAAYKRLIHAVEAEDWPEGGKNLNQIRQLVGINTLLGLLTIVVAAAGRYFI
jgi:uncharacterized membrane protein